MKTIQTIIGSLSLIFAGTSCMEAEEPTLESTNQAVGGGLPSPFQPTYPSSCNICGKNSPVVDGVTFYELALDRETANSQGMRLVRVLNKDGKKVNLGVDGDVLVKDDLAPEMGNNGYQPLPWEQPWIKLKPKPLEKNSTIYVRQWNKELEKEVEYALKIVGIGEAKHLVDENAPSATTYRMQYRTPGPDGRIVDLCPKNPESGLDHEHHFVVFEGDRLDPATMTVADKEDSEGWLNFACWGSAPFKMHMMRHTEASKTKNFTTTTNERQTMLKMYAADYCGDGTVHTVNGQPLEFEDYDDLLPTLGPVESFEALWDENGAMCLDTPRHAALNEIGCAQDLPDCATVAFLGLNPWYLASANPE